MKRTTVFLIIDGGRADYARQATMPFLHGLARQSQRGSFISPPGFAQRTAFFTGRYPDTSGNFSAFIYDPDHSPFRWLRKFGPLPNLVKPRKVFVPARWAIRGITKRVSPDCYHTDPAWIPPRFLPFFRPCEDSRPVHAPGALGGTSIFDLCRERSMGYSYRAHPVSGDDEAVCRELVRDLRSGSPERLHVAQFSIMDQQGHIHGPDADYTQKDCLTLLDRRLAAVHAALDAGYDQWDLFLCADHGMGPVQRRVNVVRALRDVQAKPGEDYVMFVNSTLAVFWYLTEHGRRAIEAALPAIEGARVVSDIDRHRARMPTVRQWGDRMLAAEPGVLFWPDYFHVQDSVIRGMHGYLDKSQEGYGMVVLARKGPDAGAGGTFEPRPLVDVFPTLCDLLGLEPPPGQEGKSLLARGVIAA